MLFGNNKHSAGQKNNGGAIRYSDFNYYASKRQAPTLPAPTTKPRSRTPLTKRFVPLVVVGLCVFAGLKYIHPSSASPSQGTQNNTKIQAYDDPANTSVVVNKHRPLSNTYYAPASLATPAVELRLDGETEEMKVSSVIAEPTQNLFASAKSAGLQLLLSSGYRSAASQKRLYSYYVSIQGKAAADEQSARPGYSEHQTGLAVDIAPLSGECNVQACFANLPEGVWLRDNAYTFGFIIRYPEGKETITGFSYEPWHLRYVGPEIALKMHDANIQTLEEYFKLGSAPGYN